MIDAVSSSTIAKSMRAEIVRALKTVDPRKLKNERPRTRGPQAATNNFKAAALAKKLIDDYDVRPKRAAQEAAFDSVKCLLGLSFTQIDLETVKRDYRTIKDVPDGSMTTPEGTKIMPLLITQGFIADALARLPASAGRKSQADVLAGPPFAIAVVRLYKSGKN